MKKLIQWLAKVFEAEITVEKIVEKEKIVEVPVEKIKVVEKVVEVPTEKVVEVPITDCGVIHNDVTIEGDLTVKGRLFVNGGVFCLKKKGD